MIFLNGRLVEEDRARIDPADRGLLLGDGLFETLRSHDGRIAGLAAHLERLRRGAEVLGLPLPDTDLAAAAGETLAANGLATGTAALRITLTRGPGPRGLAPPVEPHPTLTIAAVATAPPAETPLKAVIAATRRNEQSPLAQLKTLNYLDNVLAKGEAEARGADDALLLNTAGRLACASAANLFLVRGRRLLTPPPGEGVLSGVTRAEVIALAAELDLAVAETPLEPDQLRAADEAFLTNSLIRIRPLTAVNDRPLADGTPGPVTRQLQEAYRALSS